MNDKPSDTRQSLADLLCFSVYSAGHAFNHFYRPLLAQLGLTYPQYLVMRLLWDEDGRMVKEIGRELRLESNTLTPLLKRLEALRLIRRSRDLDDERIVRVDLTDEGRAMEKKASHVPDCVAEATGLAPKELAALIAQINSIRDRLVAAEGE